MTAREILQQLRESYPVNFGNELVASFAFTPQQNKGITGHLGNDTKTQIIQLLLLDFSIADITFIRKLLHEEVNTPTGTGDFDNLRLLCSYLFSLHQLEDVFLLSDAKFNSKFTTTGQYLDWQLMTMGHTLTEVIDYVQSQLAQDVALELRHKTLLKRLNEYAGQYSDDDIARYRSFDLVNYYESYRDKLTNRDSPLPIQTLLRPQKPDLRRARDIINQARQVQANNYEGNIVDANLLLRTELTTLLLDDFSTSDIELIRSLLIEELKCEKATKTHNNLYTLCYFLFMLEQREDFFLVYEAKFNTAPETGAAIDWEMLTLGQPVHGIVHYVRAQLTRNSTRLRKYPGINEEVSFLERNFKDADIAAYSQKIMNAIGNKQEPIQAKRIAIKNNEYSLVPAPIEVVFTEQTEQYAATNDEQFATQTNAKHITTDYSDTDKKRTPFTLILIIIWNLLPLIVAFMNGKKMNTGVKIALSINLGVLLAVLFGELSGKDFGFRKKKD